MMRVAVRLFNSWGVTGKVRVRRVSTIFVIVMELVIIIIAFILIFVHQYQLFYALGCSKRVRSTYTSIADKRLLMICSDIEGWMSWKSSWQQMCSRYVLRLLIFRLIFIYYFNRL